MLILETFLLFTLAQNFVFKISWTALLMFVIKNNYMHWADINIFHFLKNMENKK